MSATRTQVYLTAQQRRRIDQIAARDHVTMAEVIRTAVDRYLQAGDVDQGEALSSTFGAAVRADVPPRDEWSRE